MKLDRALEDRDQWAIGDACSMTRVLELLSTTTVFQVVRELFLGTTRFDDFVERTESSAPAVSRALKQLQTAHIVDRVSYQAPGQRVRYEYRMTDAGEDLLPVMMSLVHWGDVHLQNGRPPLSFVDGRTGEPLSVRVTTDTSVPSMRSADIALRRTPRSNRRMRSP